MTGQQLAEKVPLEAVESSNLSAIGYNDKKQILAIQFKNGSIFHYTGITLDLMTRFVASDSFGRFYAHNIRGKFAGDRITGPCAKCGAEGWIGETCDDCGTAQHERVTRLEETVQRAQERLETREVFTPTRVMINKDEAVSAARAEAAGILPDVIFVRDDGWSLGAPLRLMDDARNTWRGKWVEQWAKNHASGLWVKRWPLPDDAARSEDVPR